MAREATPRRLELGSRIKGLRKRRGLSQPEMAAKLGVTAGAVGQWEIGKTSPPMDKFKEVADLLGVSVEWLLTGKDGLKFSSAQNSAEDAILRLSRHLDRDRQDDLIKMLHGLTGRCTEPVS